MTTFEKNMQLLKEYNEILFNRIQGSIIKDKGNSNFFVTTAKNGEPTLQYIDGEHKKFLLSSYNPSNDVERWASKLEDMTEQKQ